MPGSIIPTSPQQSSRPTMPRRPDGRASPTSRHCWQDTAPASPPSSIATSSSDSAITTSHPSPTPTWPTTPAARTSPCTSCPTPPTATTSPPPELSSGTASASGLANRARPRRPAPVSVTGAVTHAAMPTCAQTTPGLVWMRACPPSSRLRSLRTTMKVKCSSSTAACRGKVQPGAGDDESKRRPWALRSAARLAPSRSLRCAPRCRARARLSVGLAILDSAFVGALGLERELAFGVAHRLVGRPDAAAALPAGAPAVSSRRRIFFLVSDGCANA